MSKKIKKKVKCDISYYTKVCEIIPIVKIHAYSYFSLSITLNFKISIQMLFVEKIHQVIKAKPAENFNS